MARNASRKPASKRATNKGRGLKVPRRAGRGTGSSSRSLETVLAAFAHDVRTPLTGILALSELLATSGLGERERRWVAAIKDSAVHLDELTTLVVDAARSGARRLPVRHETFDLARFASLLAASVTARAEAKNLVGRTEIAADLPDYVNGDPAQLRVAMENLVSNAVKFTERGEVGLKIAAAPLPRGKCQLSFAVSDNGIGMSGAEIKRLFRPFAQASKTIAAKFGGSGLGLVQVRRLARAMGGDLTVESVPGRGSTFTLTVVVARADRRETREQALAAQERLRLAGQGLKILCVEDNPYGRVVMNAILTELGHQVGFAGSGEGAIEAVARDDYDAVLMDITLSGMDGLEATRRIRALPGPSGRVPVIGISGRSEPGAADAAIAAGMNAYLTKPVSPRDLAAALGNGVENMPADQ